MGKHSNDKKRNLFGYPNLLDKWEVLVLSRFYLFDNTLIASQVLSNVIGKQIKKGKHGKKLGCWCRPKACHGDVLIELAEAVQRQLYDAQSDEGSKVVS
jgi:hypothetical protein